MAPSRLAAEDAAEAKRPNAAGAITERLDRTLGTRPQPAGTTRCVASRPTACSSSTTSRNATGSEGCGARDGSSSCRLVTAWSIPPGTVEFLSSCHRMVITASHGQEFLSFVARGSSAETDALRVHSTDMSRAFTLSSPIATLASRGNAPWFRANGPTTTNLTRTGAKLAAGTRPIGRQAPHAGSRPLRPRADPVEALEPFRIACMGSAFNNRSKAAGPPLRRQARPGPPPEPRSTACTAPPRHTKGADTTLTRDLLRGYRCKPVSPAVASRLGCGGHEKGSRTTAHPRRTPSVDRRHPVAYAGSLPRTASK